MPGLAAKRLIEAQNSTRKKIEQLKTVSSEKPLDECYEKFFRIVRVFFTTVFHITYQYTYEEFAGELKRRRLLPETKQKILDFLKVITDEEYLPSVRSREQLIILLDQLTLLLSSFSAEETSIKDEPEKFPLMKRISQTKKKIEKSLQTKNKNIALIHKLILDAHEAYEAKKYESCTSIYAKITELYKTLNEKERKEIYREILSLYKKLSTKAPLHS